ncbi:putative nuclease HARBI1 [Sitodiplosis mosellana]|uniref:putative nuclease HARBI1 n=1 Tax=Sitodiplosis mosellana TaxID=263140 RepID=UPI0024451DD8|nr:putative nuclease HARBI1 [Sitodiplosis mosellana]
MISRYVNKYTDIISSHLAPRFIKFPQTQAEIDATKLRFEAQFNVPGLLSIVDGTHVAISAMSREVEHAFVNRKGFHSINVQIACDARMVITNINARYPGSTHDSFIFLASRLYTFLRNLYERDPHDLNIIIGDYGYPLLPFLMTPFEGDNLTMNQTIYNDLVVSTRTLIERTIGLLKTRFRCIMGERQLRYHQTKVSKIVHACATLHNFLILNGFDIFNDIDPLDLAAVVNNNQIGNLNVNANLNLVANRMSGEHRRNQLANELALRMQIN